MKKQLVKAALLYSAVVLSGFILVLNPAYSQPFDPDGFRHEFNGRGLESWTGLPRKELQIVSATVNERAAPFRIGMPVAVSVQVRNTGSVPAHVKVGSVGADLESGTTSEIFTINPWSTGNTEIDVVVEEQLIRARQFSTTLFLINPARSDAGVVDRLWRDSNVNDNAIDVSFPVFFVRSRIDVSSWYSERSRKTDSNRACFFAGAVNTAAIAPVRYGGVNVGYVSTQERGADPVPCVRTTLIEFQPYARFLLSAIPGARRIIHATLRFTETNPETNFRTGRISRPATHSVGLSESSVVPFSGERSVAPGSVSALDPRTPWPATGSARRSVDITDWMRAWLRNGSTDVVTFLGFEARQGYSRAAWLEDVYIDVVYD